MPYLTGTAASFTDLLTALQNGCTANGWTLAGNVLSKDGCYVSVTIGNNGEDDAPLNKALVVQAGNGIDGSNNLTDAADAPARLCILRDAAGSGYTEWDWPVNYYLHVLTDPDEVYLFVNYFSGQFYQQLFFGKSPAVGNAGTGNWYHATIPVIGRSDIYRRVNSAGIAPNGGRVGVLSAASPYVPAPFFWGTTKDNSYPVYLASQMHGCIDNISGLPVWSNGNNPLGVSAADNAAISAAVPLQPLMTMTPDPVSLEAALLPCQILQGRPNSKTSLIGELKHLRFTRNDYIDPQAIIARGAEKWCVYPCYRKNAAARDGGANIDHSGTIAIAIRYDGP